MPAPSKTVDSMVKNLTMEEREIREKAEDGILPDRQKERNLQKPPIMAGNSAAAKYWNNVLARMAGLLILDDLDSDALGVYCVMMARYQQQCKILRDAQKMISKADGDAEAIANAMDRLDTISSRMQSLERNILQYAEKLGLTPSGRVRLAQKRAAAIAANPDGDLFGD